MARWISLDLAGIMLQIGVMSTVPKDAMLRRANDALIAGDQERVARTLGRFSDLLSGKKRTDRIRIEEALRQASQRVSRGR